MADNNNVFPPLVNQMDNDRERLLQMAVSQPLPVSPTTTHPVDAYFESVGSSDQAEDANSKDHGNTEEEEPPLPPIIPTSPLASPFTSTNTHINEELPYDEELQHRAALEPLPRSPANLPDQAFVLANVHSEEDPYVLPQDAFLQPVVPNDSVEEEKQEEDEELALVASVRSTTSRVSSYSRTTTVTYATTRTQRTSESVPNTISSIQVIQEPTTTTTTTNDAVSRNEEVSTDVSTTAPSLGTDEEYGGLVRTLAYPPENPKKEEDPPPVLDVQDCTDQEDDDESSIDWEHIKAQRDRDRRFGCIMFQSGLVGVVIAIILLVLQMTKSNKEKAELSADNSPEDAILAIMDLPQTTLDAMEDPTSPQGRAFEWIKADPWLGSYTYSKERARQRMGLATLYYATKGEAWDSDDYFLSYDTHECDWMPNNDDFKCNVRYQLTSLGLKDLNLQGTIPPETWSLIAPETLEQVVLAQNQLEGTIGTEIGYMTILAQLDLSQNQFTGSLPMEIGRCQQLQALILSSLPLLQGTIPPELMTLRRLKGLWWRDTGVRGSIPSELGAIPSLQIIDLSGNLLRGSLPDELFTDNSLPSATGRAPQYAGLQQIRVSHNRLIGTIPVASGRILNTLQLLDVADNHLDSTKLPSHLATLTKLSSLQVGGNSWTGAIPTELALLSDNLELLGLHEAQFLGPVPTAIFKLTQLQALYLHDNAGLEGTIVGDNDDTSSIEHPLPLSRLSNLKELSINNTPLTGTLPADLCAISILSFTCNPQRLCGCGCECLPDKKEELDALTDVPSPGPTSAPPTPSPTEAVVATPTPVPPATTTAEPTVPLTDAMDIFVANLPNYTREGLRLNPIDGPQVMALDWLFADPNVQTYSEPRLVQRFAMACLYYALYGAEAAATETAWLSYETHECFWSAIDKPYATCQTIETDGVQERFVRGIFLDPEGLTGTLPAEVALFSSLVSLQGSNSNMIGSLPTELGLLTDLQTLRLPENKLQGPLPTEIGRCTSLKRLHLGSNERLNGLLPSELGLLTELQTLVLSHNAFAGTLPETLPGSLQTLDLSGNEFYGALPLVSWAQNTNLKSNLRRLRISEGDFQSPLATEIGQLTGLSELAFSQCKFSGTLPSELGLLTRLSSLDASFNEFNQAIPATLGKLTLMRDLHLHSNNFSGSIPQELVSLTRMEQLTLHDNEILLGRIPDSFSDIPALEVLTVNATGVSGRIPSAICVLDEFSYSCSAWLCGCRDCPCEQL